MDNQVTTTVIIRVAGQEYEIAEIVMGNDRPWQSQWADTLRSLAANVETMQATSQTGKEPHADSDHRPR